MTIKMTTKNWIEGIICIGLWILGLIQGIKYMFKFVNWIWKKVFKK